MHAPMSTLSLTKQARIYNGEKTISLTSDAGKTGQPLDWSFSISIIPSKEIPGLISIRMDWVDLLAVQGTLKSLLQHHMRVGL